MNSEGRLYSLDQVAEQLGLHVRTVRAYVRRGRLKAVRIGKQYRVAHEDLESIVGTRRPRSAIPRLRRGEVSSVVQADAVSQETAQRIANHLQEAVKTPREDGSALRVETIYDLGRAQLKVIVIGSLSATANILGLLRVILED